MYELNRVRYERVGINMPDFDTFREIGLIDLEHRARPVVMLEAFRNDPTGALLRAPSGKLEVFSERIASFALPDCPGHPAWPPPDEWLGSPQAGRCPFHLLSDRLRNRLHSQLDVSPYSAVGKIDGRQPVYIHPSDAKARDIPASGLPQGCAAQSCLIELGGPVTIPPPVTAFKPPPFITRPGKAA